MFASFHRFFFISEYNPAILINFYNQVFLTLQKDIVERLKSRLLLYNKHLREFKGTSSLSTSLMFLLSKRILPKEFLHQEANMYHSNQTFSLSSFEQFMIGCMKPHGTGAQRILNNIKY